MPKTRSISPIKKVSTKRKVAVRRPVIKPTLLQPRFRAQAKITLSNKRKTQIPALKMANLTQARQSVIAMKLRSSEISGVMDEVSRRHSQVKQIHFTRGLMASWKKTDDALSQSHEMVNWARGADVARKRMVCKAFSQDGNGALLVHNIGGMERKDARSFMKEFIGSGGSVKDVVEWMAEAGRFLRKNQQAKAGTDGWLSKAWNAVSGAVGSVVDWTTAAINTVADALEAAGKHLGRAIKEAADWAISKVTDLVEGLIRAGKSVVTILAEALKQGVTALKKFVRALINAGRQIREVLKWAATQTLATVKKVVSALMEAGKAIKVILVDAMKEVGSVVLSTVRALFSLGKKLTDIVVAVVRASSTAIRKLTDALLQAGKKIGEILSAVMSKALSYMRLVVRAMLQLGQKLSDILYLTYNKFAFNVFKKIIEGALIAGRKIADFITAGISRGWALLRKSARALVALGQKVADIVDAAVKKGSAAARWAIQGLKDAGRKIGAVLAIVGNYAGMQLKRLIRGLYQVYRDPVGVIKRFAVSKFNTIRMVLDGLLQAGLTFTRAVKTILENVGGEFRKGFFKGLVALGKGLVEIMAEALKLGLALAGLALATILDLLGGHRPLTAQEKREARKIFGSSIDLSRVKVAVASIPADLLHLINNVDDPGARPFTTMYVLNFASWRKVTIPTLIHELTHTWQGVVAGPIYMIDALHAQFKDGSGAYDYSADDLRNNNGDFSKFNPEQQASIVEDYYIYQFGSKKGTANAAAWAPLLKPYARQVYRAPSLKGKYHKLIPTSFRHITPTVLRVATN